MADDAIRGLVETRTPAYVISMREELLKLQREIDRLLSVVQP